MCHKSNRVGKTTSSRSNRDVGSKEGEGAGGPPDFSRLMHPIPTGGGHCVVNGVLRGHFVGIKM